MGISLDKEKCTGCGSCESACPFSLITIVNDKADIKVEGCNLAAPVRMPAPPKQLKSKKT